MQNENTSSTRRKSVAVSERKASESDANVKQISIQLL